MDTETDLRDREKKGKERQLELGKSESDSDSEIPKYSAKNCAHNFQQLHNLLSHAIRRNRKFWESETVATHRKINKIKDQHKKFI